MRLLHFVFLFSYCLLGSANQANADEADCDDQNVFQAADEVLRSFNGAKEDGNQFVLYRITEARKKEENGRVHIFMKFKIQESVCQVKNGIDWQRCAFKANEADCGECSAHVVVNTESKNEIISQNCSTTKVLEPTVTVVHHPCLGCFHAIDTKSDTLLPILHAAIEKMNRVGNHQFHFDLENITKAEKQVVHGWNYKLEYEIRQTNCSKSLFPIWSPEKCSVDKNGQDGYCKTKVFVTPNEEIKDIHLGCHSSAGFCLSCPEQVEKNDPELLNMLKKFIEEYNSQSNHTNLYKVQSIATASKRLVLNKQQYQVGFNIQETNCSKSKLSVPREECDTEPLSNKQKKLFCEANINVGNETVDILPGYRCNVFVPNVGVRITIRGFSPLRSIPSLAMSQRRISSSFKNSKGKENGPNHKEEKHGKKQKKDKTEKGGGKHNGKHDHSSEESAENDRPKPAVLPRPTQQAIPPVPEIDTSVLVTASEQTNPTNADNGYNPPLTQPPAPFTPSLSHSLPLLPAVPGKEETYPNIHETVTSVLPVLEPEVVPKCPGKLWQPLLPSLQITTDKPFILEDLILDDVELQLEAKK
ncbi:hypothetical protein GDO78_016289 [Eleutherodactylus coqui]|uniref:Cystatin kininogen-type domain-containing protein n=1 Tax=Eleutherodactylus coqui TaxID=57060 RepID=A0A8J6ECV2_ELECQ|nr:hypothetical protein GDO78_016289 [Eleutherodactylus coqui]